MKQIVNKELFCKMVGNNYLSHNEIWSRKTDER